MKNTITTLALLISATAFSQVRDFDVPTVIFKTPLTTELDKVNVEFPIRTDINVFDKGVVEPKELEIKQIILIEPVFRDEGINEIIPLNRNIIFPMN